MKKLLLILMLCVYAQADTVISGQESNGAYHTVTVDSSGNLVISASGGGSTVQGPGTAGSPSGGVLSVQGVSGGTPLPVTVSGGGGSGTNTSGTAIASAAYTSTQTSSDITNTSNKGGHFIINTTAFTSGVFTPHIQGKAPDGTYYDILVGTGSSTVTATGVIVVKVYPGIGVVGGGSASDILPVTFRVQMVGTSTPSATFAVTYNLDY